MKIDPQLAAMRAKKFKSEKLIYLSCYFSKNIVINTIY